jgi:hypothetical protein
VPLRNLILNNPEVTNSRWRDPWSEKYRMPPITEDYLEDPFWNTILHEILYLDSFKNLQDKDTLEL